ncbi:MAG: SMC-Scp complex subunit ScpB [Acidimicrobiales bacterium]
MDHPTDQPIDQPVVLPDDVDRAIEALVMVADQPVEPSVLAQLLEIPVTEVEQRCRSLAAQYEISNRGFQLARVAGGYRYQSHPDQVAYVERYVLDGQSAKLSAAALETLSIVAYKQPISRAQVTAIRGVNVDGVMRTLVQRGFVTEVGHDPGPGQATLYGTTQLFLERIGLDRIEDLPPLGQFVPGGDVVETLERTLLSEGDPRRRTRTAPGASPADTADEEGDEAHDERGGGRSDADADELIDLTGPDAHAGDE